VRAPIAIDEGETRDTPAELPGAPDEAAAAAFGPRRRAAAVLSRVPRVRGCRARGRLRPRRGCDAPVE
jgi:hypothetical protein